MFMFTYIFVHMKTYTYVYYKTDLTPPLPFFLGCWIKKWSMLSHLHISRTCIVYCLSNIFQKLILILKLNFNCIIFFRYIVTQNKCLRSNFLPYFHLYGYVEGHITFDDSSWTDPLIQRLLKPWKQRVFYNLDTTATKLQRQAGKNLWSAETNPRQASD